MFVLLGREVRELALPASRRTVEAPCFSLLVMAVLPAGQCE